MKDTNYKFKIFVWIIKGIAVFIMLQTLFFKFSASEESVFIFSTLGIEPWGRIGTGVIELIASLLLIIPRTTFLGAFISVGLMSGAILSHLLFLGIEVKNDNGQLFLFALIVFFISIYIAFLNKSQFSNLLKLKI
ncbi:MAG: DoxX family protein [Cytophagia bacterium]|nr:MAG: DoxX family protein [Cytophagia bacterium]